MFRFFSAARAYIPVIVLGGMVACILTSCATLDPKHRHDVVFQTMTTHDDFQLAAKHVTENTGGELVERPSFTPRSADISDISRRSLSSTYVGYMGGTQGGLFDSIFYDTQPNDSIAISIHSYYPLIMATALAEELDHPAPVLNNEDKFKPDLPMSLKSKTLFQALTLITPALGNTYLYTNNPFVENINITPEILIPLLVDAGFTYFLLREMDQSTRPGTYIFGVVGITMRVAGIMGLSAGVDRYNTLARSGYDLSLDALENFRARISVDIPIQ
ncbi:MAG TPA: hypothetical protein VFJ29_04480 [Candidatus Kapabacteria bacterium]|nr:hypothetical protein [Candidatus Kapabacteria bacterium]